MIPDPNGILDLPRGFSYGLISPQGAKMDDGLFVPGNADGMAAFLGESGRIALVRNHEFTNSTTRGPFGPSNELLGQVPASKFYDYGRGSPPLGGTTTIVFHSDRVLRALAVQNPDIPPEIEIGRQFLSLAGTMRNCAGGPTPWGSWLTCEESVQRADAVFEEDHGYIFEVPAMATGLVDPAPLISMGRFNHEAAAVDPRTGIAYMTEDRGDSLLYRLVPNIPGQLSAGGRLQALEIHAHPSLITSNHTTQTVAVGQIFEVHWVDLDNVTSPNDDLRLQGAMKGAAVFTRGEGMWWGEGELFFTCTDGGLARRGQVWRLTPSKNAFAGVDNAMPAGLLQLFLEFDSSSVTRNPDNMTVAPWGHLFVCEDGSGTDCVVGISPAGKVYKLARNARSTSELAGVTFSPDGEILFLNVQVPGATFAITGPW